MKKTKRILAVVIAAAMLLFVMAACGGDSTTSPSPSPSGGTSVSPSPSGGGAVPSTGVRYKKLDDGTLMPLELEWISSDPNPVSDLLTTMLLPEVEKIGMKINKTAVDFTTLLTHLYRDGVDPFYNMLNLAVGFAETNSYWYDFNPAPEYLDDWNDTNINDPELAQIVADMKKIPADDQETWLKKWVEMQVRFNYLLPKIPLYSNDYHDFYIDALADYDASPIWNWARAIIRASLKDGVESQIIRGSTTDVNQYMWAGPIQNSASNADIWYLLHRSGYSVVTFEKDGVFRANDVVVKSLTDTENADGSKTFTFVLNEDLTYNDGTPITAKDYAFGALLTISPEFGEIGADTSGAEMFTGGQAFANGDTKIFSGLRLLGDYSFSLTVAAEELPYHYELSILEAGPYPIGVIAPGVDVKDDGEGAYLTDAFTADLIRETLLNEQTGYFYAPKVTDGPYQFVSYDAGTKSAILEINPKFKGTAGDHAIPTIKKIILKKVETATMMDELETGSVTLLDGTSTAGEINKGLDLVDAGGFSYTNYPRNGFGFVSFKTDVGPSQFVEVRQAIAYCLDRNEFANQYASGYAMVVDGWYGASQPEYIATQDELEAKLTHYGYDLDKAKELLIAGGWIYDSNGNEYVE
ncbi:hypothetical protein FACS18949_09070 [Clostridia bacterium]|nr:hypothetical protein FACS18949_09070 [Clostridia bacterium]